MTLSKNQLSLYERIDLFARYQSLSERYSATNSLSETDTDTVLAHLRCVCKKFNHLKSENFFGIRENSQNFEFRFHLILKYGLVETVIWGKHSPTGQQFGGALIRVTKLIQMSQGQTNVRRLPYPRFANYAELEAIATKLYDLYSDFKLTILDSERPH